MDFSKAPGRCRFADSGLGWKPAGGGDTFTLTQEQMLHAFWNRAARGYEVKIYRKDAPVVQFDGFQEDDYDRIQKIFKNWYAIPFDRQEHSLRGWNWGKSEFGKAELSFNVQSRSAFEIPYTEVSNTNLAGKGEVAVEFSLPGDGEETGTNGHLGGARGGGKKAGAARDQLVEMRFYIPGMTAAKTKSEDGEDGEVDEDAEEQQAADVFYQTLSEKAEIGEVAGDTIATFQDVLHLTPRYVHPIHSWLHEPNWGTGVVSMWICIAQASVCAARHMTTRFSTIR
jgi:structure-specific recognition protein 1